MENLLDYLLYALFGHNVTGVRRSIVGRDSLKVETWIISFEGAVYIALDTNDLAVIRELYIKRYERLDDEERARYEKIFSLCV